MSSEHNTMRLLRLHSAWKLYQHHHPIFVVHRVFLFVIVDDGNSLMQEYSHTHTHKSLFRMVLVFK